MRILNMLKKLTILLPFALVLGLTACGGDKGVKPESVGVDDRGVQVGGVGDQYGPDGQPIGGMEGGADLLAKKRVYFELDSSSLDPENRAIVEAHAAYLSSNPDIRVALEGHADERGTREYNLALGERRANGVSDLMQALGVGADRITSISYGEEKPVALGHNESAWRLNRRVEILYGNY
jgi:peptidoglycan-associated lipoprotein